jgi:hypothetical protein
LKSDDQIDKLESETVETAVDDEGSLQFQDLQELKVCSRYKESDGEEEHKGSDQKLSLYFPPSDLEQSVFSIETRDSKREQKELDQQVMMHVFLSDVEQPALYEFQDPIATYMEMFCSGKISVVVIFKIKCLDCKYDFKDNVLHATVWMSVTFLKVGIQLLSWLHWKFSFT